jgi:hypothetical protein
LESRSTRREYSQREGDKAEAEFMDLMILRGSSIYKSSKEDDIFKHIDFYVNDTSVDVKANRHIDCIWMELQNVNGYDGWLKGEAEYIVFDIIELDSFCVFKRKDLLDFALQFTEIAESKNDFLKLYTRKNRKDILLKAKYSDIKHLENFKILKDFYKAFSWAQKVGIRIYPQPKGDKFILVLEQNGKTRTSGKEYTREEWSLRIKEFYIYLYKKNKSDV